MANSKHQSISEASDDTEQTKAEQRIMEEINNINAMVVRIHSRHPIENKERASLLAEQALINLELSSYEEAIKWCDKSLAIDEENFKALYCKSMALIELDRLMDAMPYLKLAVKMSHNNVEVSQMFEEVKHVYKSFIDRLPDDLLIQILLLLSSKERMRVELVSKRFNRLAKTHGWSNFCKLSYGASIALGKRNMGKMVVPLFERCGRFLQEINMNNFREKNAVFYKQLSGLPNLRHLIMGYRMTAGDIELTDSAVSSKLKSLDLGYQDGWNGMLKNCSKLELLKVRVDASMSSINVPPTLKYLDASGPNFSSQFLRSIFEQADQLQSLLFHTWGEEIDFTSSFKLKGLKYFSVSLDNRPSIRNAQSLERLLKNASSIKALDVTAFESFNVESVARCVDQLEHLQIKCNGFFYADYFVGCANNLCFLSSLSIISSLVSGIVNIQLIKFFQQLALHGNLVYFEINGVMPMKSICKALRVCTNLKYLSWKYEENTDWDLLLRTLDEIHVDKKPSDEDDYEHILRLFGFYQSNIPSFEHPWLKLCFGRIVSPIREQYRVGCLSSKPKFVDR